MHNSYSGQLGTLARKGNRNYDTSAYQVHVARQPIYNASMRVYGYELLYRSGAEDTSFNTRVDPDAASSRVIINSFHSIGIDKLTGPRKAFINFTGKLLNCEAATLFSPEKLVVEILENVQTDPQIVNKCVMLKRKGYRIALDDFTYFPGCEPLVELADFVKLDFMRTPPEELRHLSRILRRPGLALVAEKVETREQFLFAQQLGCSFFQGYYFSKPVVFSHRDVQPITNNQLKLLNIVNKEEFELAEVSAIVQTDLALTYKLLRLVNCVAFGFRYRIRTVHHALVALGIREVRKWVTLIAMMDAHNGQGNELVRASLIRAKLLEEMALQRGMGSNEANDLFMLGLLSMMDVIMDQPFSEILSGLSLDERVRTALNGRTGPFTPYLELAENYETGCWEVVFDLASKLTLDHKLMTRSYREALNWCISIFGS